MKLISRKVDLCNEILYSYDKIYKTTRNSDQDQIQDIEQVLFLLPISRIVS